MLTVQPHLRETSYEIRSFASCNRGEIFVILRNFYAKGLNFYEKMKIVLKGPPNSVNS